MLLDGAVAWDTTSPTASMTRAYPTSTVALRHTTTASEAATTAYAAAHSAFAITSSWIPWVSKSWILMHSRWSIDERKSAHGVHSIRLGC